MTITPQTAAAEAESGQADSRTHRDDIQKQFTRHQSLTQCNATFAGLYRVQTVIEFYYFHSGLCVIFYSDDMETMLM